MWLNIYVEKLPKYALPPFWFIPKTGIALPKTFFFIFFLLLCSLCLALLQLRSGWRRKEIERATLKKVQLWKLKVYQSTCELLVVRPNKISGLIFLRKAQVRDSSKSVANKLTWSQDTVWILTKFTDIVSVAYRIQNLVQLFHLTKITRNICKNLFVSNIYWHVKRAAYQQTELSNTYCITNVHRSAHFKPLVC